MESIVRSPELAPNPETHVGSGPLTVPGGGGLPYVADPLVEFEYGYDEAGNLKEVVESSTIVTGLGATTAYTYDSLGRVTRITQTGTGATDKRVDFAYRDDSSYATVTRYADLAGTVEVATSDYDSYDVYGRLTGLTHRHGLTDLAAYTWQYDAADRITQMIGPDGTSDLGYDATNQLTSADHSYQGDESYVYDDTGNRETASGASYTTGAGNRLANDGTFQYLYDQEGNRIARFVDVNANSELDTGDTDITEYEWDYRNRLVKVTERASYGAAADQVVEYSYDYLNRRFEKTVDSDGDGTPEDYFYSIHRGDELALELTDADGLDGTGQLTELSQRYLYGSAVDEILAVEDAAGDVLWGLGDHEGTIRDLVDSTGTIQEHRQYDTFGQITSPANPTADFPQAFTGRPLDTETGLYNYRARWYDAAVGRFVSEDPSGFAGGDANLYRYAGNSPVIYVDPSGLCYGGVGGGWGKRLYDAFVDAIPLPIPGLTGLHVDRYTPLIGQPLTRLKEYMVDPWLERALGVWDGGMATGAQVGTEASLVMDGHPIQAFLEHVAFALGHMSESQYTTAMAIMRPTRWIPEQVLRDGFAWAGWQLSSDSAQRGVTASPFIDAVEDTILALAFAQPEIVAAYRTGGFTKAVQTGMFEVISPVGGQAKQSGPILAEVVDGAPRGTTADAFWRFWKGDSGSVPIPGGNVPRKGAPTSSQVAPALRD